MIGCFQFTTGKRPAILLSSFALAFMSMLSVYTENIEAPVPGESEKGYLTAVSDVDIKPGIDKIFISPQTTLPVLMENDEAYYFLVSTDVNAACCKVPKYQKYLMLMEPSKDGKRIYFRGGIEAETVPLRIDKDEELTITGEKGENYKVSVERKSCKIQLFLPKDGKEFQYSSTSKFAKFAEEQKKKGLEFYNNEWIASEKAILMRTTQKEEKEKKQRIFQNLKAGAEAGAVVLKNGKILHGSLKGGNNRSEILFESKEGQTYQISVDDAADMNYRDIVETGWIDSGEKCVISAKTLSAGNPGEAIRQLDLARKYFLNVSQNNQDNFSVASIKIKDTGKMRSGIETDLKKKGFAIYEYKIFPEKELDYHLGKKHILLSGKFWIEPAQLCGDCEGEGYVMCGNCNGSGKNKKICENCRNGFVTCHICEGSGHYDCRTCGGSGSIFRTCSRCGGSGYIAGLSSSYYGGNVLVTNGVVMVTGTCWPWYPSWTTSYCPVCGGSGMMKSSCYICGGNGRISCPKNEKCSVCKGLGYKILICSVCSGKGKVACAKCNGKGFIGDEQKVPESILSETQPAVTSGPSGSGPQTIIP